MKNLFSLLKRLFFSSVILISSNKLFGETFEAKTGGARKLVVELSKNLHWYNVSRPINEKDLHGRIVLLDFWTHCCVYCMNIIPELQALEKKYGDRLVVIGIHCPKFQAERQVQSIRQAILRNKLSHPVVNDPSYLIWQKFGVRAWPTLVLIGPDGNFVDTFTGRDNLRIIEKEIDRLLEDYDETHNKTKLPIALESDKVESRALAYPAKIVADKEKNMIVIADTNHNRIVVADFAGNLKAVVGCGLTGKKDGKFAEASFYMPHGVAIDQTGRIYVADYNNNLLRLIDLDKGIVETVAGNGNRGYFRRASAQRFQPGNALLLPMDSPWGIDVGPDKRVYIAMAGSHQVWVYDPEKKMLSWLAGSGFESIIDGSFANSAFAQPSGIVANEFNIYVIDAESSAVRNISLKEKKVSSVVGQGLFVFGDTDGKGKQVRLQHPLGITINKETGELYIADSFNNQIKKIDIKDQEAKTLKLADVKFAEPGGLCFSDDKLYIADTNNNRVMVLDLKTLKVAPFKIEKLELPEKFDKKETCPLPPDFNKKNK